MTWPFYDPVPARTIGFPRTPQASERPTVKPEVTAPRDIIFRTRFFRTQGVCTTEGTAPSIDFNEI